MADTLVRLAEGTAPLARSTIYTAGGKVSVVAIDIANPTGSTQNVKVWLSGNLLFDMDAPSKGMLSWHGPQIIETGELIEIQGASTSVEYHVSGVTIV